MNLYHAISKRKSTRQFINDPLESKQLDNLINTLENFELLFLDSPLQYRIVSHTKGLFNIEAPHYLIISGQGRAHDQVNAGFIGQKFVLFLHTLGIGSIWQGMSKDSSKSRLRNDLIVIGFGKAKETIERELTKFKRKKIEEITNIIEDNCLKAVRLAPSGLNLQPWYFEKRDDKIIVYQQILKAPLSFFYKLTAIDMGIALSHYKIACEHFKKPFAFKIVSRRSNKKGYKLFGEIIC